jgi:nucleoprotein TPR
MLDLKEKEGKEEVQRLTGVVEREKSGRMEFERKLRHCEERVDRLEAEGDGLRKEIRYVLCCCCCLDDLEW